MRDTLQKGFYLLFKTLFGIIFRVFFGLDVKGAENIPKEGGVIVAANHSSYLDPPVIGAALNRQATYMAREGLFKIPLLRIFVAAFSFPVKRGRPRPSTIKEAVQRLKKGELIVIFPEGGRSKDGNFLDPKRGIGLIATMSMVPVVPALIRGTEKAFPVGARFIRPARISVTFGRPMIFEKKGSCKDQIIGGNREAKRDFQEMVTKDIMNQIMMLVQNRGEHGGHCS